MKTGPQDPSLTFLDLLEIYIIFYAPDKLMSIAGITVLNDIENSELTFLGEKWFL
jgi:hypothetical protein